MFRAVLLRGIVAALLLVTFASSAVAQEFFAVRNVKKEKWPEAEANRIYLFASQAVEREFRLTRPIRPQFTLVLGFEGNELDVNSGELRLAKWDRKIFADGVILFCMEQMLTPEMRGQLLRRTLLAADATVAVDEQVARSEHIGGATAQISATSAAHGDDKR
jgi:hypothetical protein